MRDWWRCGTSTPDARNLSSEKNFDSDPSAVPTMDTPTHRYSRRQQYLRPEVMPLELPEPRSPPFDGMATACTGSCPRGPDETLLVRMTSPHHSCAQIKLPGPQSTGTMLPRKEG
ncbi:hypothetical protein HPB50_000584 [Hyalomma asiaticum]|uniref:Uncharacterized protein n=1 Tax=Hyalomma asiaticum TaxID=266040 RepID=A0ACB7T8Q3_HYAAI|nr:hypothetical protein HPB50_000584 [Hyalomma asiaticum]